MAPEAFISKSWPVGDFVYTCPPSYISALMDVEDRLPAFDPDAINEELPADLYDRLMRIPFSGRLMRPDGMEPHQFAQFGPFIVRPASLQRRRGRRLILWRM